MEVSEKEAWRCDIYVVDTIRDALAYWLGVESDLIE